MVVVIEAPSVASLVHVGVQDLQDFVYGGSKKSGALI